MDKKIKIFETQEGDVKLDVLFSPEEETVWLSLRQLSELFQRDKSVISRHINSILKNNELERESVVAKYATTAEDNKTYKVDHYNLDAILAVGYRINSKRGIQFRKWANIVLKEYLLRGYALNKSKLFHYAIEDIEKTMELVSRTMRLESVSSDISIEALNIIKGYAKSWELLYNYDEGMLEEPQNEKLNPASISYNNCITQIQFLKKDLTSKKQAGDLFGKEKNNEFESILKNIEQTFDGTALYQSVEERAAHLFYFIIKDHPFYDGNKRVGCLVLLMYLEKNKISSISLNENTLVTMALLVAESHPEEKELMIKLIRNIIRN